MDQKAAKQCEWGGLICSGFGLEARRGKHVAVDKRVEDSHDLSPNRGEGDSVQIELNPREYKYITDSITRQLYHYRKQQADSRLQNTKTTTCGEGEQCALQIVRMT